MASPSKKKSSAKPAAKKSEPRVAVVTGSTSGIGLGIANALAAEGCHIVLNGFGDSKEIESIRSGLEKTYKVRAIYVDCDLSKPAQVQKLIHVAEEKFGRVDILVNNAGMQYVAPVQEFSGEKWEQLLSVNLSASFYTIHEALPGMQQRGFGRIINIASAHGLVASKNKSAYVASKHGLVGLTKVVALENATADITCNAICPGWVLTPLVQAQIDTNAEKEHIPVKDAEIKLLSEKQPSLRFATPEEIGALVVYLCSESARSITGTTLSIDGGWTAQ
ncbi:MAG: 3-hydroxybutyrate dehydrogenase [Proteobacteria bacterium]|nr:3-hydroxybutyrate dehydrogenase [Pseudomonadota bacterium]